MPPSRCILLVTGLEREARIIGGDGAEVIVGGGCGIRLAQDVERVVAGSARVILSMGIAGGLRPGLASGAVVIASAVVADDARIPTTAEWCDNLRRAIPGAVTADIVGVDRVIAESSAKRQLRDTTGAAAVDMESHIVARIAARGGIPFAALRVVADPVERSLPPAAQAALTPDGRVNFPAVMRSVLTAPGQIPALVRTALDAERAFGALSRCRRLIGSGFCLPDLHELSLDMA